MCYNFLGFVIALYLCSCASVRSQSASDTSSGYKEDLSIYRPKYTADFDAAGKNPATPQKPSIAVIPQQDITKLLNSRIDSLAVRNKKIRFAQGFRVLVYTGNSSEEVKKVRLKLRNLVEDETVYDEFKQPTFRVKAGDFYNRLDAYYMLSKLQKDFPNAIVVPDQINIIRER